MHFIFFFLFFYYYLLSYLKSLMFDYVQTKQDNLNNGGVSISNNAVNTKTETTETPPVSSTFPTSSNTRTNAGTSSNISPKPVGQSSNSNMSVSTSGISNNNNKEKDKELVSASTTSPTSPVKGKGNINQQIHQRTSSTSSTHAQQLNAPLSQLSPHELLIRCTKKEEEIQTLLVNLIKKISLVSFYLINKC
jgi:hypothetical protein